MIPREGAGDCARDALARNKTVRTAAASFMCACFNKRCKVCQTLYQSRMKRKQLRRSAHAVTMAVSLIVMIVMPFAMGKSRHCTLRVHAQANENDGSVFANPITTPITGKNVFIEKIPTISERDVAAFRSYSASDGSYGALLELNDHGRLALETLSTEHRGRMLLVLVNGRAVTELMVDRAVSDGRLYLASGLSASDIALMEKDWPAIGATKRR